MAASIGGRHLQLKEQLWLAEKICQNGNLHLQSKEKCWLVELVAIFEEHFAFFSSTLKLESPQRHLQDRPWKQIGPKAVTESTLRRTPKALVEGEVLAYADSAAVF